MWTWFQIKVINKGRGCPGKTVVWGLLWFAFDFYHVWTLQTQTGHLPSLFQLFSNEMRILGRKWCQGPQCMAAFKAWELTGYAPLSTSVKDAIILMACNWSLVGIFIHGVDKCCKCWLSHMPPAQHFSLPENLSLQFCTSEFERVGGII